MRQRTRWSAEARLYTLTARVNLSSDESPFGEFAIRLISGMITFLYCFALKYSVALAISSSKSLSCKLAIFLASSILLCTLSYVSFGSSSASIGGASGWMPSGRCSFERSYVLNTADAVFSTVPRVLPTTCLPHTTRFALHNTSPLACCRRGRAGGALAALNLCKPRRAVCYLRFSPRAFTASHRKGQLLLRHHHLPIPAVGSSRRPACVTAMHCACKSCTMHRAQWAHSFCST